MKVNRDWELERDYHGWQLKHYREGINPKTNKPTRTYRSSYHSTMEQCLDYIIDMEAGAATDAEELKGILHEVRGDILTALKFRRSRVHKVENGNGANQT